MTKDTVISNIVGEDENGNPIFIDRIYGDKTNMRLIQKDGTVYKGALNKRRIFIKGHDGNNFTSHVYETADGRWFDRGGMPIDKPKNLDTRKKQEDEEEE